MAIISKIRKQSILILVLIGLAMVLFILGDAFTSGTLFKSTTNSIGSINGNEIEFKQFDIAVKQFISTVVKNEAPSKELEVQVSEQIWNEYISQYVVIPLYNQIGINVTDDEILEIIKSNPFEPTLIKYFTGGDGQIISNFRDSLTGGLNGQVILQYLKSGIYSNDPKAEESKQQWILFKKNWMKTLGQNKLNNLLSKGIYTTTLEAKLSNIESSSKYSFRYVLYPYSKIKDSEIKIDESELKNYYNEHKYEKRFYQEKDTRTIQYITFPLNPSKKDSDKIINNLISLKEGFENTNDDTLFIIENADSPFNTKYYTKKNLPEEIKNEIENVKFNDVLGPYIEDDYYKIAKLIKIKIAPDSVKASHILIQIEKNDTAKAYAKIDSIKTVILKNNNFDEMAKQFSKDQSSAVKGGDLGWFQEGVMVTEFNDFCFNPKTKINDDTVVETQFGIHILKITNQTPKENKYLLSVIDSKIEISDETYTQIFNKAKNFYINNKTPENFNKNGQQYGIKIATNVQKGNKYIDENITNSGEIIRWIYEQKVGSISEPFLLPDKYVISILTEIKNKGILDFENVKNQIEVEVKRNKKFDIIKEKIITNVSSLENIASKIGVKVDSVYEISFKDQFIKDIGNEPSLLGKIPTLKVNEISSPINGNQGVYIIQLTYSKQKTLNQEIPLSILKLEKSQIENQINRNLNLLVQSIIIENAKIEDNRGLFY